MESNHTKYFTVTIATYIHLLGYSPGTEHNRRSH